MSDELPPPLPPTGTQGEQGTPWERREQLGLVPALVETTGQVLLHPADFFRRMPIAGGLGAPVVYALIVGYLGIFVQALYQAVLNIGLGSALRGFGARSPLGSLGPALQGGAGLLLQMVLGPVFVLVGLFVGAGIYHLILMVIGQAKEGFEATLRVVAYGHAASVLMVLPFCGGLVAVVWWVVIGIVGLSEAHRIGRGSAAVAVLAPIVLACCCCGISLLLVFGGIAGLASHLPR
jgi:hypothetical protein